MPLIAPQLQNRENPMPTQTIDQLRNFFRGDLIQPTDTVYDSARKVYNAMIDKRPKLIARCVDAADVTAAVQFGRENELLTAVLSDDAKGSITRLLNIDLTGLGSIGQTEQGIALRRRTGRFAFVFELEDNRPDSSGGVISRIPLISKVNVSVADPKTGVISVSTVTESN